MGKKSQVLTPEQARSMYERYKAERLLPDESQLWLVARRPLSNRLRYEWAPVKTYLEYYCAAGRDPQNNCPDNTFPLDCTHFVSHALNTAGVFVKPPSAICSNGLCIRVDDLAASFYESTTRYSNVKQLASHDETQEGDFCFIPGWFGLDKVHAMVLGAKAQANGAYVWGHTNSRCNEFVEFEGEDCVYYRIDEAKEEVMPWELTGNNGTNSNTNFLGTIDNQPLVIKTNGAEALRIDTFTLLAHAADFRLVGRGGGAGNNSGTGRALVDGGPGNGLIVNYANDFGSVSIPSELIVGSATNPSLWVRHINGKDGQSNNADALYLNWVTGQPVWIGQPTKPAILHVSGDAVVGSGTNATLLVRHINGKDLQSNDPGELYLNFSTGQSVWIGQPAEPAALHVSGDAVVGSLTNAALVVRHINGKQVQSNNADALYLNSYTGKPVVVGTSQTPSGLIVNGHVQIGSPQQKTKLEVVSAPKQDSSVAYFEGNSPNWVTLEASNKGGSAALAAYATGQSAAASAVNAGSGPGLVGVGQAKKTSFGVVGAVGGIQVLPNIDEGGAGVYGVSKDGIGTGGQTVSAKHSGVEGINSHPQGIGAGLFGKTYSTVAPALYAENVLRGLAGNFLGNRCDFRHYGGRYQALSD